MKILTYNVLCYGCEGHNLMDRKDDVVQLVRNYDPDVFGIQEAHWDWMKVFIDGMPDYDYVGAGREDGKKEGEFSPVFYKKDKFDLLDKGWFWISETPDVPSKSWNTCCIRICSWAKLKCKKCGKEILAMNTHLDHRSELARSKGVELINNFVKKFDCPMFITGDFNIPEKTDCYNDMVNAGIFKDTKYIAEVSDDFNTFHTYFHHKEPEEEGVIDYIFVNDDFDVKSYQVIKDKLHGAYPSDHCPVIAEVTVK